MKYSIFNECQENRLPGETEQEHMERIIRICMEGDDGHSRSINDMLMPHLNACSRKEKTLTLEFWVEEWMLNPGRTLHGGIMSTCCDMTMGMLARYLTQSQKCVTVNLNMNFLRSAQASETVLVTARAEKQGRRVQFLSAQMTEKESKKQLVDCTAVFM